MDTNPHNNFLRRPIDNIFPKQHVAKVLKYILM